MAATPCSLAYTSPVAIERPLRCHLGRGIRHVSISTRVVVANPAVVTCLRTSCELPFATHPPRLDELPYERLRTRDSVQEAWRERIRSGYSVREATHGWPRTRGAVRVYVSATGVEDGRRVLVVGATGGVGQLAVASLLAKGVPVRAVVRDVAKAAQVFAGAEAGLLEVTSADLRFPEQLKPELVENVGWVLLATGTTAFPSKRWDGNNGPEQTDYVSVKNFVEFCPKTIDRIVLVSSVGVTRYNQLPYSILNLFGVLKFKRMGEEMIQTSGIPYTLIRPGRLTDGPYTSFDLNTLLKATSGSRKSVIIKRGDSMSLEASRIAVAEAAVQALFSSEAKNEAFELASVDGPWPGSQLGDWNSRFAEAPTA